MAKPKLKVSLSKIAKEIVKVERQLENLADKATPADKKKITLEIRELNKFHRWLKGSCKASKMTQVFLARMTSGCKK